MTDTSTFDRLVAELTNEERRLMLERIESGIEIREATPPQREEFAPVDLDEEFRTFPLWRRFWIWIRSMFAGTSRYELMRRDEMQRLLSEAEREAPQLVRARDRRVTQAFLGEVELLRKSSRYFSSALSHALGRRKPEFFALLAGIEIPELRERLIRETDPFHLAEGEENPGHHRIKQHAVQNLDEATTVVPGPAAERLEEHARALASLYALSEFDFGRFHVWREESYENEGRPDLASGEEGAAGSGLPHESDEGPKIEEIGESITELAGVLQSLASSRFSTRLLETLWIFLSEDAVTKPAEEVDQLQEAVERGKRHVEAIFESAERLPLDKLAKYVNGDVNYRIPATVGPDSWKELVRNYWNTRIDRQITIFRIEQEIREVASGASEVLGGVPRPFSGYSEHSRIGRGLHALSLGVCEQIANTLYPQRLQRPLYRLLIDGEFYKQENREEYDAAYTVLNALAGRIEEIRKLLAPEGEVERATREAQNSKSYSERSEKIEQATKPLHDQAKSIVRETHSALKSVSQILYGILYGEVGGRYDTLSNLGEIGGREHDSLMRQFDNVLNISNSLAETLDSLLQAEEKLADRL